MSFDPPKDPVNLRGQVSAAALRRTAEQAALPGNTLPAGAAGYRDLHGAVSVPSSSAGLDDASADMPRTLRVTGGPAAAEGYLAAARVTWDPALAAWLDDPPGDAVWLNPGRKATDAPGSSAPVLPDDLFEGCLPAGTRPADGLPVYAAKGVFGAAGGQHSSGLVPDPGPAAGATRFLREDATWQAPPKPPKPGAGPGDTIEITQGGTLQFDPGSTLVMGGPTWNVTSNTALTVSAAVSLTFVGGNVSTSVIDITSLSWKYESTSILIFAGCTWNITASTTTTITGGQTWVVTGGTLQYTALTIDLHTGTVVNLTANQTWTITTGVALTLAGGTLNLNSTLVFGGPSFTFGLAVNTILLCGDVVFDVCDDPHVPDPVIEFNQPLRPNAGMQIQGPVPVPVVIDPGATLEVQGGGELDLNHAILDMGTGLEWDITDDVTTTISAGKGWKIAGGKFDLTGTTVTGAGVPQLTHVTGTTADAYVSLVNLSNAAGIHGSYVIANTGSSNSLQGRVTYTDMFGNVTVGAPFPVGVGQSSHFVVDTVASASTPIRTLKLEAQSLVAGLSAAYEAYFSIN